MKKTLVLIIEIKARDLESRLLIAYQALKKNYQVIIGSQGQILNFLKYLPPSIVLDKCISKFKLNILLNIKKNNHKIVNLDEEGLSSQNNKYVYLNERLSNKTLEQTEFFFTWGSYEQKLLKHHYKFFQSKFINTGNPRVDTWKLKYSKLYSVELNKIQKKYKDYILISSNFGVNSKKRSKFILQKVKEFNKGDTERIKIFHTTRKFKKKLLKKFIEMINYLSESFPQKDIVLRPHPADDIDEWKKIFKKKKNIFIEYKYSISPWIIASKCLVHSSCTTGIESFLKEKPTFSFLPYKDNKYVNFVTNTLSEECNNKEQLLKKINLVYIKKYNLSKNRKLKIKKSKHMLDNVNSLESSKKILNYIDKIKISKIKEIKKSSLLKFKILYFLKKFFRFFKEYDHYENQKMPTITKEEVSYKINSLKLLDKSINKYDKILKIKKISDNLFMI